MKREDAIDFHEVRDEHLGIHARLNDWSRWVRVRPHGWQVQPMFRQYRSKSWQWHERILITPVNTLEAVEMEKAVSQLPEKHREAIRFAYVWCCGPVPVAKRLGVSKAGLMDLIHAARTMLTNRGVV